MSTLHFLNVGHGDCTWIQHADGNNTVIDVCKGRDTQVLSEVEKYIRATRDALEARKGLKGNFHQKDYPVNPIEYLKSFEVQSIFRFILTHPDMDHLDGLEALFTQFSPANFWDTDNNKSIEEFDESRYAAEDWQFYRSLRDGREQPKRLVLHSGACGQFYNRNANGDPGGNGLHILAPTKELVSSANEAGDFNDCSYVLQYNSASGKRVVIGGDSHDASWEHILQTHGTSLQNIDLLLAPHHGRDSDRSYDFLDVLRPKLTLFGIARAEHLGYSAWSSRGLEVITNNQANCVVVNFNDERTDVFCTNKSFASAYMNEKLGRDTFFNPAFKGWYVKSI